MEFGKDFWRIYTFFKAVYSSFIDAFGRATVWFFPLFYLDLVGPSAFVFIAFLGGAINEILRRISEEVQLLVWISVFVMNLIPLPLFLGWGNQFGLSFSYWLIGSMVWSLFAWACSEYCPWFWRLGKVSITQDSLVACMEQAIHAIRKDIQARFGLEKALSSRVSLLAFPSSPFLAGRYGVGITFEARVLDEGQALDGGWLSFQHHWHNSCGEWVFISGDMKGRLVVDSELRSAHERMLEALRINEALPLSEQLFHFGNRHRVHWFGRLWLRPHLS